MFLSLLAFFAIAEPAKLDTLAQAPAIAAKKSAPTMQPNPVFDFLKMADKNDFQGMRAAMASDQVARSAKALTHADLIQKISDCYLRRVYGIDSTGAVIAAWMCAEGAQKSRVLVADIARTKDGKVLVIFGREDRNDRPAPARSGSAFAN